MRILILGCSPLTDLLLNSMSTDDHQFTIIGTDINCLSEVADEPRVNTILNLEPWMQDYLRLGGIDRADAFLALSEDDHQNILASQIAKHIFNVDRVVCKLEHPALQQLYSELELEVISPTLGILQDLNQSLQRQIP